MVGELSGDRPTRVFSYICRVGGDGSDSRNGHRGGVTKGPPDPRDLEGIVSVTGWGSPVSCFDTRTRVSGSHYRMSIPHSYTLGTGRELVPFSGVRVL